jgi:hypothetical protein
MFMAALFALIAPEAASTSAGPASLDVSCYRLMAELAEDEDPRISSAGLTGAQYFLGRIDAQGLDPDLEEEGQKQAAGAAREQLLEQCSALMGAGGRDFRTIGNRLTTAPGDRPLI